MFEDLSMIKKRQAKTILYNNQPHFIRKIFSLNDFLTKLTNIQGSTLRNNDILTVVFSV